MTDYAFLRREIADGVATITLNKPEVMNAVTPESADELRRAVDGLQSDGARALIITGEGRAFCAGANLSGDRFSSGSPGDNTRRNLQQNYNPFILALNGLDIPVVTAVNGAAAGIGCSIALSGDIIIAARSAYFLQAFVNIGLVPDGGSTWLLPRLIGLPRAMEMMMLGERMPAERAEQIGLINRCVDDDTLMDAAREMAARLAAGPTLALGMMRRMARNAQDMHIAEALNHEAESQRHALNSSDSKEGVLAFQQKRIPQFKGE